MQNQTSPLILTFGATDPIGATGIQADLATFAAMGCHGLSAVTSLLIADTSRVEEVQVIDADWVSDQARAMLEDMPVAAIKVGIPGSVENIAVIAEIVSDYPELPLILDPFVSGLPQREDNDELLTALRELLVPQATLLIASAVELERLAETWREPADDDMTAVDAMHLVDTGCEYVLVTGSGADAQEVCNLLFDGTGLLREDRRPRLPGTFSGAGSTLSAALCAMLANGMEVPEAAAEAQEFTHAALSAAQRLGMGKLTPDRYFWTREPEQPSD
ncbi:bifunctional hydroxymethylpyrimidine kinase/phosphomethylpyrimidine kinase [Noviherbaspirillum aridicola]|uniref:hydroxymethylpyrimidine kinase n=1 Tax=Noviherbaspirillum aridicola TaxID=2849687 RepID=A0ABQ4Q1S2_9BURK|nr:hydroxymethylpyrimidine/phosphomethylpyrimidine kinase [Noviherbaspirillum aridicola]GIZ51002.1 hydroxymethylpyrimidine/phosphomethylpyrimidine kinase [Noviherbaspirillum aridicola]